MKTTLIPVTPFQQNCTLLWDETSMQGAVVDPGGDIERILATAEKLGVSIVKILITHGHIDHAGGTAALKAALESQRDVPVEGPHEGDDFLLQQLDQQGQMFGLQSGASFTPERWLKDGDTVTVGDLLLEVLHCPGHTPGHVVFFHRPSQLAIVGDVLFQGSIGRTDLPGGDTRTLIQAIRGKLWPLGNEVRFIPGHGPLSTFGEERRYNPFVGDNA